MGLLRALGGVSCGGVGSRRLVAGTSARTRGRRSGPTLGGRKATAKCTFHPFDPSRMEEPSTMPDPRSPSAPQAPAAAPAPAVPPTPPVALSALLAREDLGLRR